MRSTIPEETRISGELRLWKAVFGKAMYDLAPDSQISDLEREQAASWVGTPDFRLVCSLAGCEPDVVQEQIESGKARHPEKGWRGKL